MADQGDERRDEREETAAGTERAATEVEREGMDLLGRSSVRDGALEGVSDSTARTDLSVDPPTRMDRGGQKARKRGCDDPDTGAHSGTGDGGISAGGGVAGGARGNSGSSPSAGDP